MKALAIDSSTGVISCALSWEGGWSRYSASPGVKHAELLMPMADSLFSSAGLSPSDLDLVICASGPGSFTGLRIALSTAKGICAGSGADLVLVPTLDYMAAGCPGENAVVPVIDARKGRAYAAVYRGDRRDGPIMDLPAHEIAGLLHAEPDIVFTGPDADLMAEFCAERPGWRMDPWHAGPRPEALMALGLRRHSEGSLAGPGEGPLYVRTEEADIGITRPGAAV